MDQVVASPTQAGHNRPRNPGVPLAPDSFEASALTRARSSAAPRP